jgi:pyruvate/2-oxoglutarate dehydrogenase complex dihydrolipoamide dehydrogenase (E3) component
MAENLDVAIVGAGPFGLSVAAHLQRLRVRTFGEEMETWRTCMPREMLMRSAWEETSLSAAEGAGTLDEWARETEESRHEPIPLEMFLRYSAWFAERFVRDRDPSRIASVEASERGYRLTTEEGSGVDAKQVVVAVGVMPFAYLPPRLAEQVGGSISLATGIEDAGRYPGKRVLVVGGGQAGLEAAGLAAQAGGVVELVTQSSVRWFADREPHYPRGRVRGRLYRLAYPVVGYGPPPLNRIVMMPDLFAALPERTRRSLSARILRSGGSPWLRGFVERSVRVTEHNTVAHVEQQPDSLVVRLTDGTEREVDHILIACGYRFDLDRLSFLSREVRARIATRNGWPVIDRFFRSSDPGVFFVGYAAEHRFGPLSRFVLGADFTANRLARALT